MSDALGRLTTAVSDRYAIERELGAGGIATVHLAHDVRPVMQNWIELVRRQSQATNR